MHVNSIYICICLSRSAGGLKQDMYVCVRFRSPKSKMDSRLHPYIKNYKSMLILFMYVFESICRWTQTRYICMCWVLVF